MTIPTGLEDFLSIDAEVMHGKLCFKGTRVSLAILLDNLEEGIGLDEFVEEYPSVTREQAQAVIAWEQRRMRQAVGLELAG